MKKTTLKIARVFFVLFVFGGAAFSQTQTAANAENNDVPYDKINVRFVLDAAPSPADAGFDNPASFWQFRYELRFLNGGLKDYKHFAENAGESVAERTKRIKKNNKQYDRAWKKSSVLVARGGVPKTSLASPANREIIIAVPLSPEIQAVLAKAANTWQNPAFRLKLVGKFSGRTDSGMKFKRKLSPSYVCQTKVQDRDAQYWLTNTCGIYMGLKITGNKITGVASSRL